MDKAPQTVATDLAAVAEAGSQAEILGLAAAQLAQVLREQQGLREAALPARAAAHQVWAEAVARAVWAPAVVAASSLNKMVLKAPASCRSSFVIKGRSLGSVELPLLAGARSLMVI